MKNDILWISSYVPYDSVGHAGGKIHNFYLKYLHQKGFNIKLATICTEQEKDRVDLSEYGIDNNLIILENKIVKKIARFFSGINAEYNIYHKYAGKLRGYRERPMKALLKQIYDMEYSPQIIIIEWTEMILLLPFIKSLFPKSKYVLIEEDVSYLSYYRIWKSQKNKVLKYICYRKYKKLKDLELTVLKDSNIIVLNNYKDKKLIIEEGIKDNGILVWCPYFDDFSVYQRRPGYQKIIFYGAMNRKENYLSAIWFIDKVMPLLADLNITFEIVGGNPPEKLKKYESDRVHIKGFVKDVAPYFQEGLCLVAPLVLGAGVKIKVLEALSSGLPVLTNSVGIEGIYAEDKQEYFLCEEPEEYACIIKKIYSKEIDSNCIEERAKKFIKENYSREKSAVYFEETLKKLMK